MLFRSGEHRTLQSPVQADGDTELQEGGKATGDSTGEDLSAQEQASDNEAKASDSVSGETNPPRQGVFSHVSGDFDRK